jgi:hypothetical protein
MHRAFSLSCGTIIEKILSISKLASQGKKLGLEENQETFSPFTWLGNYGIDLPDFLMSLDHGFE